MHKICPQDPITFPKMAQHPVSPKRLVGVHSAPCQIMFLIQANDPLCKNTFSSLVEKWGVD